MVKKLCLVCDVWTLLDLTHYGTESSQRFQPTYARVPFSSLSPSIPHTLHLLPTSLVAPCYWFLFELKLLCGIDSTTYFKHSSWSHSHSHQVAVMLKKLVVDDPSFVTPCIILLEATIRKLVHCGLKRDRCGQQQYSGGLWYLKHAWGAQSVPRKYPQHQQQRWHLLTQSRTVPSSFETHQTRQCFSSINLLLFSSVSLCEASVSCSYQTGVVLGVVFCCYSPLASMFRDALLHIMVLKSSYLSYCWLSVFLNQSEHYLWLLTSTFSPRDLLFTGYFLLFRLLFVNPRDCCAEKSQYNHATFKAMHFFIPILMLSYNFSRSSWPWLNEISLLADRRFVFTRWHSDGED